MSCRYGLGTLSPCRAITQSDSLELTQTPCSTHLFSMMRYNGAMSLTLAARAFSSTLFIFLVIEATHVLFEVYATQVCPLGRHAFMDEADNRCAHSQWWSRNSALARTRSSCPVFGLQILTSRYVFTNAPTLTRRGAKSTDGQYLLAIHLPRARDSDSAGRLPTTSDLQGRATWINDCRRVGGDFARVPALARDRAAKGERSREAAR